MNSNSTRSRCPEGFFGVPSLIDAYSVRLEAQRRLLDPKYRDIREQLRQIDRALDEAYAGQMVGIEEV